MLDLLKRFVLKMILLTQSSQSLVLKSLKGHRVFLEEVLFSIYSFFSGFLEAFGSFWWLLAAFGFWWLLAAFGFWWPLAFGGFWPLAAFGFRRLLAFGGFWRLFALSGF